MPTRKKCFWRPNEFNFVDKQGFPKQFFLFDPNIGKLMQRGPIALRQKGKYILYRLNVTTN